MKMVLNEPFYNLAALPLKKIVLNCHDNIAVLFFDTEDEARLACKKFNVIS